MAEAIKGKQNTGGNDKLIAFAKILDDIQSIGAPLKNIEKNTAVLPKLVAMLAKGGSKTTLPTPPSYYQKVTRAASERKRDEKGRFVPSKPIIASKSAKLPQPAQQRSFVIAKPSLPKPVNDRVKMPAKAIVNAPIAIAASAVPEVIQKKVARQNKTAKAAPPVTSIAEAPSVAPSQRDSKGRFQGSIAQQAQTDSKAARQANDEKKTLSQSIKDGFKAVGSHTVGALKDGVQSVDTKEAAGQAAGGPLYSAGKELYGAAQDIKEKANDESTLIGKAWKGIKTKTGVGNKDKPSGAVVSEIKASENKEDKRHKELLSAVKAIDSGAHSEVSGGYGMPRVTKTGPGSSQKPGKTLKEKPNLKNVLKRGADGKLSISRPKAGGGGGIGGGLLARGAGALMGSGGGLLAGLASTIGPAIAVVVAGAAGAAIGTGISKLLDMGAQKLTGDKNATAGGAVFDFFHPGTGKDTKFENKYQQYQGDVQASSQKYGVSEGYMKTMMKIESGGDPNAVSSTGAKGLYQFTGGTAKGYGIKGQEFNPSANIDAAARLARDNAAQLQRSGIAVNDSNMYMSHQLGVGGIGKGGLKDLLNSSQTGAPVSAALRKQMDVNGGQGMDAQAFLGMWRKKWIDTAQNVGADPNSMARGKQSSVTPTAAPGSPEYEKQLAEFKAKEGVATPSSGPGSPKKKGKGRGKQNKPAPVAADEVAKQEEPKPAEEKKPETAIDAPKEGEQAGSGQKASVADQPAAPVAPAPAPVQPPPPLEAVATKAPAMSYDDQQAAREGIQKDYWAKEDARRSQSGEAFKQVKGQQAAVTAEKEAKLSDIEKRRKEVDAKYDAGGLNDAEAGKQQVALDAEAEQVKKEHLAKMGDAITGGFKGVDAQSGQLLAEKDAKGKALDAQIAGVPSQVAIPATAVASTAAPVAPAPAPVQPPPPAPVTASVPEVSQLAAAMQQNNQKPDGKQPGTSTVAQNTIKTEFDDTMLTLMAYDRI